MKLLTIIFLVFSLTSVLVSGTFFVSNQGSNAHNGSQKEPWQTLQYAADQVQAGDTVLVENGTYSGFSLSTAGDSLHPIMFKAKGNQVVVDRANQQDNIELFLAHFVIIDGFTITHAQRAGISVLGYADNECKGVILRNNICINNTRWGIFTGYAKNILIEKNETAYSGSEHGIYVSNSSDNPIIRNNIAHHNNGSGIQINADPALDGDGIISNALVENNICYENGDGGGAALNFASIRNSMIKNNMLYNNHAGGMAFWDDGFGNGMGCKDNKIYNNTVVMPEDGRWALNMINSSTGNEIINNILIHEGSRGGLEIDASSMENLLSDFNIMQKISSSENWISLSDWKVQSGQDLHSIAASVPNLFVGSGDYHLNAHSAALDKGKNLTRVREDFEGDERPSGPSTDIGADELIVTAINPKTFKRSNEPLQLLGTYPNPFKENTVIRYSLRSPARVHINVFDTLGRLVLTSKPEQKNSGTYSYTLNAHTITSGIYYLQIVTNQSAFKTGRLLILK